MVSYCFSFHDAPVSPQLWLYDYFFLETILRKNKYLILILCWICSSRGCSLWLWARGKQQTDMCEQLGTLHLETDSIVCTIKKRMNSNKSRQGPGDMFILLNKTERCGIKFPPWAVKTKFHQCQGYLLWRTTHHLWLMMLRCQLPPGLFSCPSSLVWSPQSVFRVRAPVYHSDRLMHTHIPLISNFYP